MVKQEVRVRVGNKDPLVVGNQVFNSSHDWDLTEKELEKARIQLGETEDKKQKYLQELKSRLSKGNYRLDDEFLQRFLRLRKYDFERAYLSVKTYYKVRNKQHYLLINSSSYRSLKNYNIWTQLPYADEEGRIIFWADIDSWNPREASFAECLNSVAAVTETATMNPKCQVNGVIGIWDLKGLSVKHTNEMMRKNQLFQLFSIATSYVPWRINKVIITHCGRLVQCVAAIIRPLLTEKIRERVVLLGSDYRELHQYVNPAILPKELGGTLADGLCQDPKFLIDNLPYLEYDRSFTGN